MNEPLPQLTNDLAQVKRDLDAFGYGLVANALNSAQVKALGERLSQQAQAEAEIGRATFDGGAGTPNQRVWNLVNKGRVFRELLLHPLVRGVITHLLGRDFILSSLTANIAGPGGEPMRLHRDQGYISFHTPAPLVANIGWMLDDVYAPNGGTRLIPGTHLSPEPLADQQDIRQIIAAEGPAGSALVFDGRIWHGTGPNSTNRKRRVILSYFARPFLRQQENMFLSLSPDVQEHLPEELKPILGYKVWGTLGGVEGPRGGAVVQRPANPIGELHPSNCRSEDLEIQSDFAIDPDKKDFTQK